MVLVVDVCGWLHGGCCVVCGGWLYDGVKGSLRGIYL